MIVCIIDFDVSFNQKRLKINAQNSNMVAISNILIANWRYKEPKNKPIKL